jgi:hypothetical protein
MNPSEDIPPAAQTQAGRDVAGEVEPTGLPFLRTWPGVYLFVFACFVVCVALLAALTFIFS